MKKPKTTKSSLPRPVRPLTFAALRIMNEIRCETAFHKIKAWTPSDWATAMAGECGEACNVVKKLRRLDGADKARDTEGARAQLLANLGLELADLVIYTDLLATRMGLSLEECVRYKFNLVSDQRGSDVKL